MFDINITLILFFFFISHVKIKISNQKFATKVTVTSSQYEYNKRFSRTCYKSYSLKFLKSLANFDRSNCIIHANKTSFSILYLQVTP